MPLGDQYTKVNLVSLWRQWSTMYLTWTIPLPQSVDTSYQMHVLWWLWINDVLAIPLSSARLSVSAPVPQFVLPPCNSSPLCASYELYSYHSILIPCFKCMSYGIWGYMESLPVTIILRTPLSDHSSTLVSCYQILKCQSFGAPCSVCPSVTYTVLTCRPSIMLHIACIYTYSHWIATEKPYTATQSSNPINGFLSHFYDHLSPLSILSMCIIHSR